MKLLSVIFFALCSAAVDASILHVPSEYATIQEGLDAAQPGDSVLVAEGTYTENIIWPQTNGLRLLGDPSSVARPMIDGASAGRVIDMAIDGGRCLPPE